MFRTIWGSLCKKSEWHSLHWDFIFNQNRPNILCAGHSSTAGGSVEAVGSGGVVCAGGCSTQTGTTVSAGNRGAPEVRERRLYIQVNSCTILLVILRQWIRHFFASLFVYLYWRRRTRRQTRKWIPNPMATLFHAELFTFHRLGVKSLLPISA